MTSLVISKPILLQTTLLQKLPKVEELERDCEKESKMKNSKRKDDMRKEAINKHTSSEQKQHLDLPLCHSALSFPVIR